ncbi:MAG TPA: DUF1028 domain-containing protein [Actinomycetota bacterium]|nr:DUF1028 domain-containing protein [Actinomycetota bacterium]
MTYSIVARDPETGDLAIGVQSHYFSVGPIVPWAEAGVGAVATQAHVDVAYGPLGIDMMKSGRSAGEALAGTLASDPNAQVRQVAMIDSSGSVAAHTGEKCIREAGHRLGDNYSVQANMMLKDTVWDAMAKAYERSKGSLASRVVDALDAAEAEGGDIRGKQSAAIVVVTGKSSGKPWADRILELRVEDSPDPLAELRRLVRLNDAYRQLGKAEELLLEGKDEEAFELYENAVKVGGNVELDFWYGLTLAGRGKVDEAIKVLAPVFAANSNWAELLRRLPSSDLFPNDQELIAKLIG